MKVCLLNPRVFLDRDDDHPYIAYTRILECARKSSEAKHTLVDSLHEADLVLLALASPDFGPHYELIRGHKVTRRIREKLVIYSRDDHQVPWLRGLYPTIDKKWVDCGWSRSAHYVSKGIINFGIEDSELNQKDILCSFVGSAKDHHPVRQRIMNELAIDGFYLSDSAARLHGTPWWEEKNRAEFEQHFRSVLIRSQFVLCPRGINACTIRLFEAMEGAAVPVIIADDIPLPEGPDWNSFCLSIREADIASIPEAIESWKSSAREKGLAARAAWKAHFSEGATFNYLVGSAEQLLRRKVPRPFELFSSEYLRRGDIRAKLRFWKRRLLAARSAH